MIQKTYIESNKVTLRSKMVNEIKFLDKKLKNLIEPLVLLLPVSLWMLSFFLIPLIIILIVSFCTRGDVGDIRYSFTIENYVRLANPLYGDIFIKSLCIAVFTTIICLVFGYPFAFIIAKARKKFKPVLLLLVILPFWTNSLVRSYAMIIILRTEGLLNMLLMKFNVISAPMHIMYTDVAVMIGMLYMMFPFMVLPLYSAIEKLDMRILEAADDLGANPIQKFINVTLPLTKSGILLGSLLVFVPTLGLFFITDLMGGSKVVLMSNLIKNQFLTARDWPFGAAISVVLMLVMLIFILIYTKLGGKADKGGLV